MPAITLNASFGIFKQMNQRLAIAVDKVI